MERVFDFTGNRDADWDAICHIWQENDRVMSGAVGSLWTMPPQHKVCMEFADAYPDSKEFLISHLSDPDPRIAAYAFKILIRICELKRNDLPSQVATRREEIGVVVHSLTHRKTLQTFFADYFDTEDSESVVEADERAVSWQDNELARYLEATRKPHDMDQNQS